MSKPSAAIFPGDKAAGAPLIAPNTSGPAPRRARPGTAVFELAVRAILGQPEFTVFFPAARGSLAVQALSSAPAPVFGIDLSGDARLQPRSPLSLLLRAGRKQIVRQHSGPMPRARRIAAMNSLCRRPFSEKSRRCAPAPPEVLSTRRSPPNCCRCPGFGPGPPQILGACCVVARNSEKKTPFPLPPMSVSAQIPPVPTGHAADAEGRCI